MDPNRPAGLALAAVALALGVTACGGEPDVCADLDTLQQDVDALREIRIEAGALAELSADLGRVATDLDRVAESAGSELEEEVDAVRSTTQALGDSVAAAVQSPSGATLTQVSTDLEGFASSVDALVDAAADTC